MSPAEEINPGNATLPSRPRRGRWIAKAGLLTCTLALLVVALELSTRMFSEVVPPLMVADPVVCKTYLPGFSGSVYVDECDRHVQLRFHRDGFRGPDRPVEKPPGVRRIAILGDSMVAAIATDEGRTLVDQLQTKLNDAAGSSADAWEVMNFGVSGSSPGQQMVLYRNVVAKYRPDIVLCAFFVGNDLSDMSSQIGTNPHLYFDLDDQGRLVQEPYSATRASATEWLNRHSRFYVWQKLALNKARHQIRKQFRQHASKKSPPAAAKPASNQTDAGDGRWLDPGQWIYLTQETDKVAHAWAITGKVLEQFQREATDGGARFAALMIPSPEQVYDDYFQQVVRAAGKFGPHFDAQHPDLRMTQLCQQAGVPLITLTERFRQAAPDHDTGTRQQWLFLGGHGHFNDAGNRLAADVVYDFLTRPAAELAERPWIEGVRRE